MGGFRFQLPGCPPWAQGGLGAAALQGGALEAARSATRLAVCFCSLLPIGWWVAVGKQVGIQVQSHDLSEKGVQKVYHICLASGFLLVSFFPAVLGSLFTLLT